MNELEAENARLKVLADQAEKYCQEARALREGAGLVDGTLTDAQAEVEKELR